MAESSVKTLICLCGGRCTTPPNSRYKDEMETATFVVSNRQLSIKI